MPPVFSNRSQAGIVRLQNPGTGTVCRFFKESNTRSLPPTRALKEARARFTAVGMTNKILNTYMFPTELARILRFLSNPDHPNHHSGDGPPNQRTEDGNRNIAPVGAAFASDRQNRMRQPWTKIASRVDGVTR